jgi:hypothetical protein
VGRRISDISEDVCDWLIDQHTLRTSRVIFQVDEATEVVACFGK